MHSVSLMLYTLKTIGYKAQNANFVQSTRFTMKTTAILLMSIISFLTGNAQTLEATTRDGKKVILNPDGTWKFADSASNTARNAPLDCNNLIVTETDQVTGITTTSAKKTQVISTDDGKNRLGIFMLKTSPEYLILIIQATGGGPCADKGAKINFLFTDGSRLELASDGDFNCKAELTVYFGGVFGKKKQLDLLKSKKIQTIRAWTMDSYVQMDLSSEQQDEFHAVINCLMN
jgi:hypothetical protein